MGGLYDLYIYIHVGAESLEKYTKVAYKTVDNVKLVHLCIKKQDRIFHLFKAAKSPLILESKIIFNI